MIAVTCASGCAKKKPLPVIPRPLGWVEMGVASWYGHPYHGRRAASGEIYDMESMTAAHKTLPFGTWVRVKNLANDKTVDLRITDRGPFIKGRIIDLSRAGAEAIELIGPGVGKVRLEVINPPQDFAVGQYVVQVGVFGDRANAERLRSQMEKSFGRARLVERPASATQWRVLVGNAMAEKEAEALASRIGAGAFVVRLDVE